MKKEIMQRNWNWFEKLLNLDKLDKFREENQNLHEALDKYDAEIVELSRQNLLLQAQVTIIKEGFPVPKSYVGLGSLVQKQVKGFTSKYEVLDEGYDMISLSELKKYLRWNKVSNRKWTREDFDCDNFAIKVMSDVKEWMPRACFGFCTITFDNGYRHAVNLFIDENYQVWFVEPQNDMCYKNSYPGLNKVDNVII